MRGAAAPHQPYHRATIGQQGAWWRLLVTVLLGVAALFGFQIVLALLYTVLAGETSGTTRLSPTFLLILNLSLTALIPVAWLLTKWPGGIPGRFLCSITGHFRWRELRAAGWRALVIWTPLFGLGLLGLLATGALTFTSATVAMLAVVWLTQPLQCAGEEFLFRGALLQACGATRMPAWLACFVTGLLFAAAHLQFEGPLFTDRLLLGVAFAYITLATGGLEAAVALHCAVNLTGLTLASLMGDVESSLSPDVAEMGAQMWIPVAFHAVQLGIAVPWIVHGFRRKNFGSAV